MYIFFIRYKKYFYSKFTVVVERDAQIALNSLTFDENIVTAKMAATSTHVLACASLLVDYF